jgi:hypothetical protein
MKEGNNESGIHQLCDSYRIANLHEHDAYEYEKLYTVTIMTNEPQKILVCAFTLTV